MKTTRYFPAVTTTATLLCAVSLAAIPAVAAQTNAPANDRADLVAGVREIAAPGIPGSLCVYGPNAFVVATGGASGGKLRAPVVAAGRLGRGRVVAWGHDGYLNADTLGKADTGKFFINAVRWTANKAPGKPVSVGVLGKRNGVVAFFTDQTGVDARMATGADFTGDTPLSRFNVVIGSLSELTPNEQRAVTAFARRGGGVIGAETGWGYLQTHPNNTLMDNGGNTVFVHAGILFAGGMLDKTAKDGFVVSGDDAAPNAPLLQASSALSALLQKRLLTPDENAQAVWTLSEAAQALPAEDTVLMPRLRAVRAREQADFTDLVARPVTLANPLARLAFTLQVREAADLPAGKIKADPSAVSFPGAVNSGAPRVTQKIVADTRVPEWHSTGLYAAPGEIITVTLPENAARKGGLRVRIGAHRDTLWHLPTWKRAPEITRTFALDAVSIRAANAFGGPVFIEVPERSPLGAISVTIAGAVRAPFFVRGETTLADWKTTIRNAPGPWAELQGKRVILTVPSSAVRDLDDPEALMTYWDEVLTRCYELYAAPIRDRPERYCVDRQISAGYMHSGYPIMTGDDVAKTFCDLSILKGGDGNKTWGFYHEVGHNFQKPSWTWDGCGEVTNNLFSLYGGEKFNNTYSTGDYASAHSTIAPAKRREMVATYQANGAKYDDWKANPFLALTLFIELRRIFGWEPFTKVFAEYEALPQKEQPRTDDEKRDQFLIRMSRATGKNLGPFFVHWGVPTSETARAQVASLPAWMNSED